MLLLLSLTAHTVAGLYNSNYSQNTLGTVALPLGQQAVRFTAPRLAPTEENPIGNKHFDRIIYLPHSESRDNARQFPMSWLMMRT